VRYEADPNRVQARVNREGVKRILLYVHGMMGASRDLVGSVRLARVGGERPETPLAELYDLVLTFDYESVKTPIEETARDLRDRLRYVGLGEGHGKVLHVVGHGIGGLVARWLIEREGGNRLIQHLVMLGTPNAGSPWPTVHSCASFALSLGLNLLAVVPWSVAIFRGLLTALEAIDVTLDETQPGSAFLETLAASPDPGVPYSVLAGNTGLIPAALAGEQPNLAARILGQVLPRSVLHRAAELLVFLGQPNDVAVSVESGGTLGLLPRQPAQVLRQVACDHLTYFNSAPGLGALAGVLGEL
jgi:pimeloyl-ACP methyl ester carboxylesterase